MCLSFCFSPVVFFVLVVFLINNGSTAIGALCVIGTQAAARTIRIAFFFLSYIFIYHADSILYVFIFENIL